MWKGPKTVTRHGNAGTVLRRPRWGQTPGPFLELSSSLSFEQSWGCCFSNNTRTTEAFSRELTVSLFPYFEWRHARWEMVLQVYLRGREPAFGKPPNKLSIVSALGVLEWAVADLWFLLVSSLEFFPEGYWHWLQNLSQLLTFKSCSLFH